MANPNQNPKEKELQVTQAIKVSLLEQRAEKGKGGICRKMENNQKRHTRRVRVNISMKRGWKAEGSQMRNNMLWEKMVFFQIQMLNLKGNKLLVAELEKLLRSGK